MGLDAGEDVAIYVMNFSKRKNEFACEKAGKVEERSSVKNRFIPLPTEDGRTVHESCRAERMARGRVSAKFFAKKLIMGSKGIARKCANI